MKRLARAAIAATLVGILCAACSTAPKNKEGRPVYETRNQSVRLANQADALFSKGNYPDALSLYRQALKAAISADYEEGIVTNRNAIGKIYVVNGLLDDAAVELEKARAMAERLGNEDLRAINACYRGELALARGKNAEALALMESALALSPGADARATALHGKGLAYKASGDYAKAEESAAAAAAANRGLKRNAELGANLYLLSSVQLRQGKIAEAEKSIRDALEADRTAESAFGMCSDYYGLSKIMLAKGDDGEALWYLEKSLDIALVQNLIPEADRALVELISLETKMGKAEAAAAHKKTLEGVRAIAASTAAVKP